MNFKNVSTLLFALLLSSPALSAICPDGSYVSGNSCTMAPNGQYVGGGNATLAPNGSYVGGNRAILAPNGSYVGSGNSNSNITTI